MRAFVRVWSDSSHPTDLTRLIHATAQYALMIGTELHEQAIVSPDHPLLSGLIQDAVSCRTCCTVHIPSLT